MDESVFESHQDTEAPADPVDCEPVVGRREGTGLYILRMPGARGAKIVIESDGELFVVGRLHGVKPEQLALSEERILAWAEGRPVT